MNNFRIAILCAFQSVLFSSIMACHHSNSKGVGTSKLYLSEDRDLLYAKTDETIISSCSDPAYGRFMSISYWFDGKWMEDASIVNDGGFNSLSWGGYYLDGQYMERQASSGYLGCDVTSETPFPTMVTVPYKKDFKFIGQVGVKAPPPFTLTFEEWLLKEHVNVCSESVEMQFDCQMKEDAQSRYDFLASTDEVPVYENLLGQRDYLRIEFTLDGESSDAEKIEIVRLEELPVLSAAAPTKNEE